MIKAGKARGYLGLCLLIGGTLAAGQALAQDKWPSKPIRFIVPYAAGGGTDFVARTVAKKISENVGQAVVVENRAGANSIIGIDAVARSAPDGYTIGLSTEAVVVNEIIAKEQLSYNLDKDLTWVTQLVDVPFILVASKKSDIANIKDLIEKAKARPGELTYGSTGNGSSHSMAMDHLKSMTGIDMIHVPYKGVAPGLADVSGGQIDIMFTGLSSGIPLAQSGRVTALGVSSPERSPSAPDTPTIAEQGVKGYSFQTWYGLVAPSATPPEVLNKINEAFRVALLSDEVKKQLEGQGLTVHPSKPDAYRRTVEETKARFVKYSKQ